MLEKVITISLDEVTKKFIVPDSVTDLELNVWFSVVKEEWKKQQKDKKRTALFTLDKF